MASAKFLQRTAAVLICVIGGDIAMADHIRDLQTKAVKEDRSDVLHWGHDPTKYSGWTSHTLRLIPVYTFGTLGAGNGIDLTSYTGANSPYRDADKIRAIYGRMPVDTLNPNAEYMDQTNVFDIQHAALQAGKKNIILVVFDGMDWQTTWAAATYYARRVAYREGRGTGLHFQDYKANDTTQYGFMVTSPHNDGTDFDADKQTVSNPGGKLPGGYDAAKGGPNPWTPGSDPKYLISTAAEPHGAHAYPDSANTATSMMSGVKTYTSAIGVDATGAQVPSIAHLAQEKGYAVGVVSSVPISHATPAAAYAHNVSRGDYQDMSRDMLGLPSIAHPKPLPGLDVVIAGGHGVEVEKGAAQGKNFVAGLSYVTEDDLRAVDTDHGGKYIVARRTPDGDGSAQLAAAAELAATKGARLLGFYGVGDESGGHLAFQSADGDYRPAPDYEDKAEKPTEADLLENPTLDEMTSAALRVLGTNEKGFWLMVEAGDVDWANHGDNIDASIGAVKSGDDAVKAVTDWVERNSNWDETVMIVTADHGHYLVIDKPEGLIPPTDERVKRSKTPQAR